MPKKSEPEVDRVVELEEQLRDLNAEHTRLNDRYTQLLIGQAEAQRRGASALQRRQQDWIQAFGASSAAHAVWNRFGGEYGLARVVRDLPERPNKKQLDNARGAASMVLYQMKGLSEAVRSEFTLAHAELGRLREFVTGYARNLHTESGRGPTMCDCVGCRLIIEMDLIGDGDDEAPTNDVQPAA